jgi:disulfide bond formation protein DsbB
MNRLAILGASAWYWLGLLLLAVSMEAAALFFQYVLDYGPCMLCIHVRIWVFGLILVALFTLAGRGRKSLLVAGHFLVGVIGAGLLERSWQLLGVERGTIEGMCSMDLGLPAWFALDSWFPVLFKAWEPCGYTPQLLFGITMAEALVVMSIMLLVISLVFVIATLAARRV